MIVSVHIRKSGGSSFRKELEKFYGNDLMLDYGDQIGSSHMSAKIRRLKSKINTFRKQAEIAANYKVIHGHFYATKYRCLPCEMRLVTFLRHPVERVLSNYYYLQRNPERKNRDAHVIHKLNHSLEQYIAHADARNVQNQFLDGDTLDNFSFVGITEKYVESIELYNIIFDACLGHNARENVNPRSSEGYNVSKDLYDMILDYNQIDYQLYLNALSIHQKNLIEFGLVSSVINKLNHPNFRGCD